MNQLILASSSPQRKTLLRNAGFSFVTFPVNISETIDKNLSLDAEILRLAREKSEASAAHFDCQNYQQDQALHFLGADTLVFLADEVLGKPQDFSQAAEFLRRLSGRVHEVKTAICVHSTQVQSIRDHTKSQKETPDTPTQKRLKIWKQTSKLVSTRVIFRTLSDAEISQYVATGEPMGKAGAYAIQGVGRGLVQEIVGPYDNVVGLPVTAVQEILREHNWSS